MNLYFKEMDENRALYIVTEGNTDAAILRTLLVCDKYQRVYQVAAGGFGNLSSVAKTIRLMRSPMESKDKILIVFDADSEDKEAIMNRIGMMRSLTSADYDKRVGVFCFVPTIERYLFGDDYKLAKGDRGELIKYLQENLGRLRELPEIKRIQEFLDKE